MVAGPASSPAADQLGAQRDDAFADLVHCPAGAGPRAAGARLEGLKPAVPVPPEQMLQVLPAHPVARCGAHRQLLGFDLEDGDLLLRHAPDCHACPDSSVAYHVSPMS